MGKYLLNRLLRGAISVIIVVAVVMILIYSFMDRDLVLAFDASFNKKSDNEQITYKYMKWEAYGYLDYVPYADYILELKKSGEIDDKTYTAALKFGKTPSDDTEIAKEYVAKFTQYYKNMGYTVERHDSVTKTKKTQKQILFAYKNISVFKRALDYFTHIISIDNIHYVENTTGKRLDNTGISFTLFDPVYNTDENGNQVNKVFAPAIIGTGTEYKYLLYFDNQFPFIHQNLIHINLGLSYSINQDVDVYNTLTDGQDPDLSYDDVIFPTGLKESSPRNLHTAKYVEGSRDSLQLISARFTDDYTNVSHYKKNMSRLGFSFVIGIIAVALAYLLGVPLGITMARYKDGLLDKLGTIYIVFIIAVPSLAYIFLFQSFGRNSGLPATFDTTSVTAAMYILPVISLAMPSIAGLMKWLRRYMIDQQNSDYVKFARSGGLSEGEIFRKHILKNAIIPIVHGVPGSILGALVGAIITESVYMVPGAGKLLTNAIGHYDNAVIVGLTMFYAILSILSLILGDILMALVDPRISFSNKNR